MKRIYQKKWSNLTSSEQEQLEQLMENYYHGRTTLFIQQHLLPKQGYDIVLLKHKDYLLGTCFYHLSKLQTQKWQLPLYVLDIGQSMKQKGYLGNVVQQLNLWYLRKNLGYWYRLKHIVGACTAFSPRCFEHFIQLFPQYYLQNSSPNSPAILQFINRYLRQQRGWYSNINEDFCMEHLTSNLNNITADWESLHQAKDDRINQLMISKGAIKIIQQQRFKTNRQVIAVGVQNPFAAWSIPKTPQAILI